MVKRAIFAFVFGIAALILMGAASAEIYVSNPDAIYNIGDSFKFNVTLISGANSSNFIIGKIICTAGNETNEAEIYRTPYSIDSGEQKVINIAGKFDNFLVGNLEGNCVFKASYGEAEATSREFKISRLIKVNLMIDKYLITPGEGAIVSGSAIKENGNPAEGFAEARIDELNIKTIENANDGKFELSIPTAEDLAAGEYKITTDVYERDDFGKIKNRGSATTAIRIKQIPKKMGIALSSQQIVPGNELLYTITLYDQSGKTMEDNVEVSVSEPNGAIFLSEAAKSGEAHNFSIAKNYTPGNWIVSAKVAGIEGSQNVYVEELEEVSSEIINNNTLIITNTGNVRYQKTIVISIGEAAETKEVDLDIGESKKFMLSAPDGEYAINVADGKNTEDLGTSFLTGSAIVVDDGETGFWRRSYWMLWILLIGICALIAFYHFSKASNKAYYGKAPEKAFLPVRVDIKTPLSKENLITEGKRENCAFISLKVQDVIGEDANSALEKALIKARESKARMFEEGNFRTIVFAPSITGEEDNNLRAIKAAKDIEEVLRAHNSSSNEKIKFGMGIHGGELIIGKASNGEFKASPVDSSVLFAKKIAEKSHMDVGVSNNVHRRVLGKVKSERISGDSFWRVTKIMQREGYSDFINRFVKRQQDEAKPQARKPSWVK